MAKDLITQLKGGPAFLLLGQNYLRTGEAQDKFLTAIVRRFGSEADKANSYFDIFQTATASNEDSALSWMDELSNKLSVPDWLQSVANFNWAGLYTSAIDSTIPRAFKSPWREVQPIFEEKFVPADPRNKNRLHITFLFGAISQIDDEAKPPLTKFKWTKRRQVAISLLRRLPELVTPLGALLVDKYSGNDDWLPPEELAAVLDEFGEGQVHFFSAAPEDINSDFLPLSKRGIITFHAESVADFLSEATEQGLLPTAEAAFEQGDGPRVHIKGRSVIVPQDLWALTSHSGYIVDENSVKAPKSLSADARYREFRSFLSTSEGKPQWASFARGFAFRREFEANLHKLIRERLSQRRIQEDPVILHGQTGTGKTVALGHLAFDFAQAGEYPVMFIERRTQHPASAEIDRFCQWAEDTGADASLVVWDGMVSSDEYRELLRSLSTRGRKVVLVGSWYRETNKNSPHWLEAPAELNTDEKKDFKSFLASFDPKLPSIVDPHLIDSTFLVALYRLLPQSRLMLRRGVSGEIGYAEDRLLKQARLLGGNVVEETLLAKQLREIGYDKSPTFTGEQREISGEFITDVQDMTGLVMVPGQFGLRIPVELLMRTLRKEASKNISRLFEGIDVFRWYEDSAGNIEIGPRNALEATLIVHSRMGGLPQTQIEYIRRILLEIKDLGLGFGEDREVTFAVEFLRAIGPRKGPFFVDYYPEIAETLSQLRTTRGITNPRLMLQEANLLREWVSFRLKKEEPRPQLTQVLGRVETIVNNALELTQAERRNRMLRNFLFNELTATLALRATNEQNPAEKTKAFADAQVALLQARRQDPDSYYPLDIQAWFASRMIKSGFLDERQKLELVADTFAALQSAESIELDPEQEEMLQQKRLELGYLLDIHQLREEALKALEQQGSTAGFYMRALQLSGLPETGNEVNSRNVGRLTDALDFLKTNYEKIKTDARCLELMLDVWWVVNSGAKLFASERIALPFNSSQWGECLSLIHAIEATGQSRRPLVISFLSGLSLFHLNEFDRAFRVIEELERESERAMGRRRIIKSYLASDQSGRATKYSGTVSWVAADGNKAAVLVDGIRRQVNFRPRDFGRPEIVRGAILSYFHIAFNFVGLLADPVAFYKN
jgi:hypothetical protein